MPEHYKTLTCHCVKCGFINSFELGLNENEDLIHEPAEGDCSCLVSAHPMPSQEPVYRCTQCGPISMAELGHGKPDDFGDRHLIHDPTEGGCGFLVRAERADTTHDVRHTTYQCVDCGPVRFYETTLDGSGEGQLVHTPHDGTCGAVIFTTFA